MPSAPQEVVDLVERFAHNIDQYHRPEYNETQVRREFIDPLFVALGWDVDNRAGVSPRYQEVIHEASLRDRASVRAPDYCFRVGPEPKFYVEAKKPSVDVAGDVHPAHQLRSYAWTARLPLSILTDFEEFAVYDCQTPPKATDKPGVARTLLVRYEEYPERWGEIAAIFSREAVYRGDYDRYAETTRGKRGTQEVDDVFLGEIEGWRLLLARNIALRNPELGVREINYAVQQTIDRLIFMRICEDRDIEPYEQLKDAAGGAGVYARLMDIFRRADQRYNSGLFHFAREKGREEPDAISPALRIDDKVLAEIIGGLYYPYSPYAFRVLSADILGNVYERFLGSVIRLTAGHQAKVEEKPEVRKAGGVYYTPKYIVDYIVQHTVGKLCEGRTPGEIAKLRILDPACGSGSFLLGAYQYLLDYHLTWYVEHPTRQARREIYQGRGGEWFLTTEQKKQILVNNIYGVDIDPQAVEVTKLSLLLKVLEGESQQTLAQQMAMWQERALPDLARNIQCGNSLIGPDFYAQAGLLDEEESRRVNPLDWNAAFPSIMAGGGFDAVIGNPPYIRIQTMKEWAPKEVEFYKRRYVAASKGNYDIYVVFVEKGLSLLNERGRLGFILPHKFFNAQYGEPLRGLLAQGKHLAEVVHFGDQQVFENATTYTCLLFLDKASRDKVRIEKVTDLGHWRATGVSTEGSVLADHITGGAWTFDIGSEGDLLGRLGQFPAKLGDLTQIFVGVQTSADPVFILSLRKEDDDTLQVFSKAANAEFAIERGIVRPLLKGADIRRFHVDNTANVILYPYQIAAGSASLMEESELRRSYPLAWQYLTRVRPLLEAREGGKWRVPQWWQFGRNQNIAEMGKRKLVTQVLASHASFTADIDGTYCFVGGGNAGGYGISMMSSSRMSDLYILGLLNSPLLDMYLKSVSTPFRGGYFSYARRFIEQLPIRTIDFSDPADVARHDQMVALVEQMLALHKRLAEAKLPQDKTMLQRQIEATDQQIDRLVYELYGLTEEEIGIVEGGGA